MNKEVENNKTLEEKFDQFWDENIEYHMSSKRSDRIFSEVKRELEFERDSFQYTSILKYAAIFIIIASTTIYLTLSNKQDSTEQLMVEKSEALKAISRAELVTLSDNSTIDLYPNSVLRYPEIFTDSLREVYLVGSARFTIAEESKRPFIVHQGQLRTQVLGTEFTIIKDSTSNTITVSLHKGSIAVSNLKSTFRRVLSPGDIITYNEDSELEFLRSSSQNASTIPLKATDVIKQELSLDFVNVKIKDAYQTISDRTGINVDYSNIGIGGNIIISLEYKNKSVDKILKDLNSFSGYSYTIQGNTIVINK
mgnify:CR=1 FL=1